MAASEEDVPPAGSGPTERAAAAAPGAKSAYEPKGPARPRARGTGAGDVSRGRIGRRKFVWYALAAFTSALTIAGLRFFFPRTLTEPPTKVRIGFPSDFNYGVDTKFQADERIWVVKNAEGIFAILANCTHLGCTPNWIEPEQKFKCPCHGSGFDAEGVNFEGPAPRPLDRCQLELDPDGQIVVDKTRTFKATEWERNKDNWLLPI